MKLSQIFNLPNKTSISIKEVFHLKCISHAVFPFHIRMNIDWNRLEKSINTFKAYKIDASLNIYYTVALNDKNFFLVSYDKVLQSYSIYCNSKQDYALMMNIFMIFSDYCHCDYYFDEDVEVAY
jgi:hypothetical protein